MDLAGDPKRDALAVLDSQHAQIRPGPAGETDVGVRGDHGEAVEVEFLGERDPDSGDAQYFELYNLELYNRYNRRLVSQRYGPFEDGRLMAGSYLIRVLERGIATVQVVAYDDLEATIDLDVPVADTIAIAGAEHRYELTSLGGRFVVEAADAPWRLENSSSAKTPLEDSSYRPVPTTWSSEVRTSTVSTR